MHHEPARLLLAPTNLRIFDIVRRILVECTQIRLALLDDFHEACDARHVAFLPAASVEESKITELHVFHVLARGGIADTIPRLWAALGAKVVDGELGVELQYC